MYSLFQKLNPFTHHINLTNLSVHEEMTINLVHFSIGQVEMISVAYTYDNVFHKRKEKLYISNTQEKYTLYTDHKNEKSCFIVYHYIYSVYLIVIFICFHFPSSQIEQKLNDSKCMVEIYRSFPVMK